MSTEYVYNLIPHGSKKTTKTKVLTEYEALMLQLQGYDVINITELHGITPQQIKKNRFTVDETTGWYI